MHEKLSLRKFALCVVCTLLFIIIPTTVTAQDGEAPTILGLLTNKETPDIVGVMVRGTFEVNDVINLYTNDIFIKSRVVTESDGEEIPVRNISLDVFPGGENNLVAKIERGGAEVLESEPHTFEVRDQADTSDTLTVPEVTLEDGGATVTVFIAGAFEEGDVITISSEANEYNHEHTVTAEDIEGGDGTSVEYSFAKSDLPVGVYALSAQLRRGDEVSQQGESAPPLYITDLDSEPVANEEAPTDESTEEVAQEETSDQPEQQESTPASTPATPLPDMPEIAMASESACYQYNPTATVQNKRNRHKDAFGAQVALIGNLVLSGGESREVYIQNIQGEEQTELLTSRLNSGADDRVTVINDAYGYAYVGVPTATNTAYQDGRVDIYSSTDNTLYHIQTLTAPSPLRFGKFGTTIAAGDRYLVVKGYEDRNKAVIYVYQRAGGKFQYLTKLTPSNPDDASDFGFALATHGNIIAVGDPNAFRNGVRSGTVHIYTGTVTTLGTAFTHTELGDTQQRRDVEFGYALAVNGSSLFISVPNGHETKRNAGVVYEYKVVSGTTPVLLRTYTASTPQSNGEFGISIATARNILLIGMPGGSAQHKRAGAVYVYRKKAGNWMAEAIVRPDTNEENARFGHAVALAADNRMVVGAPRTPAGPLLAGATYVYTPTEVECPEIMEFHMPVTVERSEDQVELEKDILDLLYQYGLAILDKTAFEREQREQKLLENTQYTITYDTTLNGNDIQTKILQRRGFLGPSIPRQPRVEATYQDDTPVEEPAEEEVLESEVVRETTEEEFGAVAPVTRIETLERGASGNEVLRLQIFLNDHGFPIAADGEGSAGFETGEFDVATEKALKRFQSINGISVTGVLDQETRDVMLHFLPTI